MILGGDKVKTFYFTVRGDHITSKEDYVFIEGNKGSYEAVFDFGEEWEDMAKMCIVENGSAVHKIAIIGNSCLLPEMSRSSARIGVIGVDSLDGAELITRISTNMVGIGIQDGAANKEVTASLDTAAAVWEKYLSDMENSRKAAETAKIAAEGAAEDAKNSKNTALTAEGNAKTHAENARKSAESATDSEKIAKAQAETAQKASADAGVAYEGAKKAAENLEAAVESAKKDAGAAALSAQNAAETKERIEETETEAENRLKILKQDIQTTLGEVRTSADNASESAEDAEGYAQSAKGCENEAGNYAGAAIEAASKAEESKSAAGQALSDLLAMINSGDLVLATDGKLPLSSIPATATQEIYTVTSEDELTSLVAQRGDLAELIEDVNGERTITKTWQCLGEASNRENWVVWGTSYAVQSGNATTANTALNANMINNHRLVEISEEEFASAVKDADTYYLVY